VIPRRDGTFPSTGPQFPEEGPPEQGAGRALPLEALIDTIDREAADLAASEPYPDDEQRSEAAGDFEPYIRFTLGALILAVPMAASLEIGRFQGATPLPNLPPWVLGVANIRGEIVSVVDLKAFLGLSPVPADPAGPGGGRMLILVRNQEMTAGLTVDRVAGMFHLDRRVPIRPGPYREGDPEENLAACLEGVLPPETAGLAGETRLVHLLDVSRLLASPRMTRFRTD
jgi:purine-binding chemotaxis protein CheW